MTRRHNVRCISHSVSYTVSEISELLKVHKTTISVWISEGLKPIDQRRPYLIHGAVLAKFLAARNKPYQPLEAGQIFCVACKRGQWPSGGRAIWVPRSSTNGDLAGTCPTCGRTNFRRVRYDKLAVDLGDLVLANEDGTNTINGKSRPHHTQTSGEVS